LGKTLLKEKRLFFTLYEFTQKKNKDKNTDYVQVRGRKIVDLERFAKRMNLMNEMIESLDADYPSD